MKMNFKRAALAGTALAFTGALTMTAVFAGVDVTAERKAEDSNVAHPAMQPAETKVEFGHSRHNSGLAVGTDTASQQNDDNKPIIFGIGGHGDRAAQVIRLSGVKLTVVPTDRTHQNSIWDPEPGVGMYTDMNGQAVIAGLAPGNYVIKVDGQTLFHSIETVIVTAERRSKSSPIIFGIGGHGYREDKGSQSVHGGKSDEHNPDSNPRAPGGKVNINPEWDHDLGNGQASVIYDWNLGGQWFSATKSCCRGHKDTQIEFTVPEGKRAKSTMRMEFEVGYDSHD